jgi:hypothetical protein
MNPENVLEYERLLLDEDSILGSQVSLNQRDAILKAIYSYREEGDAVTLRKRGAETTKTTFTTETENESLGESEGEFDVEANNLATLEVEGPESRWHGYAINPVTGFVEIPIRKSLAAVIIAQIIVYFAYS